MAAINIGQTYTTAALKAASSAESQLNLQAGLVAERWERTMARTDEEILAEPFIGDAKRMTIPAGKGNTTSLKAFRRIPTATKPLEEGKTPTGQIYSMDALQISIADYGSWIAFTNQTDTITSYGQITAKAMFELKRSALESRAKIVRDTIISQASEFNVGGIAARADIVKGSIHNIVEMLVIKELLNRTYARPFNGSYKVMLPYKANQNILLFDPVAIAYMNFGQTNEMYKTGKAANLLGLTFIVQKYGEEADLNVNEIAKDGGTIAPVVIYGQEAFMIVEQTSENQNGLGIEMVYKALGSSGTADPLNQRGTIGWYMGNFGVKVIAPQHVFAYWASLETAANAKVGAINTN